MNYVILEVSERGEIELLTNEDGKGTMVFDDLDDAFEMSKVCNQGIVVPLHPQLMELITEAAAFIDVAKFELDEEFDESSLEERFYELLG
jgi:hypothetical protein